MPLFTITSTIKPIILGILSASAVSTVLVSIYN